MKKSILLISILIVSSIVFSQEQSVYGNQSSKNSIYGTFGFNPGEFYIPLSINFERNIYDAGFAKLNGRTGIGLWVAWTEGGLNFPLTVQTIFFKKASHLDLGVGGEYIYDFSSGITGLSHLLNIAFRYQKPDGNFLFKVGLEKNKWVSYPFLGIGYAF